MSISILFLLIALILFVLAAVGVGGRFNLTAAGLAFFTAAQLVGVGVIG